MTAEGLGFRFRLGYTTSNFLPCFFFKWASTGGTT